MSMRPWRGVFGAAVAVALGALVWTSVPAGATPAQVGPSDRLTNHEFWDLIDQLSEPNGFFQSDNLVSNEDTFQYVIPDLLKVVPPGRGSRSLPTSAAATCRST